MGKVKARKNKKQRSTYVHSTLQRVKYGWELTVWLLKRQNKTRGSFRRHLYNYCWPSFKPPSSQERDVWQYMTRKQTRFPSRIIEGISSVPDTPVWLWKQCHVVYLLGARKVYVCSVTVTATWSLSLFGDLKLERGEERKKVWLNFFPLFLFIYLFIFYQLAVSSLSSW